MPRVKSAAPAQTVIFIVHELKRPARNAAELMALAGGLQAAGIQLELLTGPLTGVYDPAGPADRGRPKVIDDDMLTFALALRAKGVPVPDIAAKLTITCRRHPWTRHFPWVDGPAWFTRTLAAFLG